MAHRFALYDAGGRRVALARIPSSSVGVEGLGFIKSKGFKKFWTRYRKPIVGGAAVAGLTVGALYTGGATLAAIPAVLGKIATVGGKAVEAVGGPAAALQIAGSVLGKGGVGGGEAAPAEAAAPAVAAAAAPAALASFAKAPPSNGAGLGGISTPLLIGGGVALLAVLMLMNNRNASPSVIEVRR